jgi:brefeldin A-inhibited guanine nucleotide-exchange protein
VIYCNQQLTIFTKSTQEQGMIMREPEEVARFLAKTQGLNKTMIGEYLGEREETCLRVMHAYVDAMDFSGAAFDQAIRFGSAPD